MLVHLSWEQACRATHAVRCSARAHETLRKPSEDGLWGCSEGGLASREPTPDVLLRMLPFTVSVQWHYTCYSASLPSS